MLRKVLLGISLIACTAGSAADEWLKSLPDFELLDQHGTTHSLDQYRDRELIVMYVQGVGCPIARIALPQFREVREMYQSQNIEFLMFNANIQDDLKRINREATEFGIDFTILKDSEQLLAKSLGVERTAEVFIIDPKTQDVLFRGPINDQLGYETQRNEAHDEYLKDALNTVLAGGTVDMQDIPDSKGCLVAIFDT
ncbi:MAG: redoxin domain-containing protein [Pseudomonadales bacterium]|nr:redoxin domain-containing protein [Pseudomonadales bacterium]